MEAPKAAMRDPAVGRAARDTLTALWGYAGKDKRFVWPSNALLASELGCSERTIYRHIERLVASGWVKHEVRKSDGRKGYCLCDPPGVVVHRAQPPLDGRHTRPIPTDTSGDSTVSTVTDEDSTDMTEVAAESKLSLDRDVSDNRILLGTNQEPIQGGSDLHGTGETSETAQPPAPRVCFDDWRMVFAGLWRAACHEAKRHVGDPTRGRHKLAGLREALEEHGGDVVRDVLLHALQGVLRHHETRGRHGLHPGKLGVVFTPDRPGAWGALLDAWQADQGKLRRGRTPMPPRELDGVPLTDEEQREWHLYRGGDHERWLRERRDAAAVDERASEAMVGEFFAGMGGAA